MSEQMAAEPSKRRPAPALELTAADGEPYSLARHRGRPVLVSFLSHAA